MGSVNPFDLSYVLLLSSDVALRRRRLLPTPRDLQAIADAANLDRRKYGEEFIRDTESGWLADAIALSVPFETVTSMNYSSTILREMTRICPRFQVTHRF